MARRWLILADDLTGAADCAIAFARRGATACVQWGEAGPGRTRVLSHDADSRQLGPDAAAARHAALAERLHDPDRAVFKKIDSTLRGQPAAELAATLDVLRRRNGMARFAILAPAFRRPAAPPRTGGSGSPAGRSRRPSSGAGPHLPDRRAPGDAGRGRAHQHDDPARHRAGRRRILRAALAAASRDSAVAVLDAVEDDDLARIARAGLALDAAGLVWIGSAGLAHALAAAEAASPAPARAIASGPGGTLVVVGSLAAISRAAARRLAAGTRMRHVPVAPDWLLDAGEAERRRWCDSVAARLAVGDDVLVEVAMGDAPDLAIGSRLATALGTLLAPAAPHLGALVATGGETAAALLARFGVDGLALVDEIEPGVSLGDAGPPPRPDRHQGRRLRQRGHAPARRPSPPAIRHEGSPT